MRLKRIIISLSVLLILFTIHMVEGGEPISLGAMNGNVMHYFPDMEVVGIYPDLSVSNAGVLAIKERYKNISNYVTEERTDHIKYLIEVAKKFAIKENTPFYAVSSLSTKTSLGEGNFVVLETMADIVALRPKSGR